MQQRRGAQSLVQISLPDLPCITEGFGPQMKRLRQARGMTLIDLGNAAYLTVDHIGKIERGSCPKLRTIGQIAAGLQVPAGQLFPQAQAPMAQVADSLLELLRYMRFLQDGVGWM